MKTILLISPQNWMHSKLSKHHYALMLAELGNKVYFLNPPKTFSLKKNGITIDLITENIFSVNYHYLLPFHLLLRYKLSYLYNLQMRFLVFRLLGRIGKIDELWNFDTSVFSHNKYFNSNKSILFLYDYYVSKHIKALINSSTIIVSISNILLNSLPHKDKPVLKINHGLCKSFTQLALNNISAQYKHSIHRDSIKKHIGYTGNLFNHLLDRTTFVKIISENLNCVFHICGSYNYDNRKNIDNKKSTFISFLLHSPNVVLYGELNENALSELYSSMDVFLCLYDFKNYKHGGNSHKILEYFSSGKVIVSNYLEEYAELNNLILMPENNDNNTIPEIFYNCISNLDYHNCDVKQNQRKAIALNNTYEHNILKINYFLNKYSDT